MLSLVVLALAASSAAPSPVMVCNAMDDDLAEVTFVSPSWEDAAVVHQIKPRACVRVRGVVPGNYILSYIDATRSEAPMCRRRVSVKAGTRIRIAPNDGSLCQL